MNTEVQKLKMADFIIFIRDKEKGTFQYFLIEAAQTMISISVTFQKLYEPPRESTILSKPVRDILL